MLHEAVVGLDVQADSITAAILPSQSDTPEVVKLSGDMMQVRRLFRRLSAEGLLRSCYEAYRAAFVIQRLPAYRLDEVGHFARISLRVWIQLPAVSR